MHSTILMNFSFIPAIVLLYSVFVQEAGFYVTCAASMLLSLLPRQDVVEISPPPPRLTGTGSGKKVITIPPTNDRDRGDRVDIRRRHEIGERIAETGFFQSLEMIGDSPVYSTSSKYQDIEVYDSLHYGRVLVIDGVTQLTTRDANSYNEMMAHVPMFEHPSPKRVLVIGGGDGYVLHEALKHSSVVMADHVELDKRVIQVCRVHFEWGNVWSDPRVNLHIADGAEFVRNAPTGYYDVIIQDSSDPFTWNDRGEKEILPSSSLYTKDHFDNLFRILSKDGILNIQAETMHIPSDMEGMQDWRRHALDVGFSSARYGSIYISSYPTGQIGFLLCNKNLRGSSAEDIQRRFYAMVTNGTETTYYQPKLQTSAFDLPLWLEKKIYYGVKAEHHLPI